MGAAMNARFSESRPRPATGGIRNARPAIRSTRPFAEPVEALHAAGGGKGGEAGARDEVRRGGGRVTNAERRSVSHLASATVTTASRRPVSRSRRRS